MDEFTAISRTCMHVYLSHEQGGEHFRGCIVIASYHYVGLRLLGHIKRGFIFFTFSIFFLCYLPTLGI